jgi:HPt (histidine-containing phosphotransfer) domain-containing protein
MSRALSNDPSLPSPPRYFQAAQLGMRASFHEAVIHEDAEALFQAVHALKSSSAMIGVLALSDFMKDLEPIGRRDKVSRSQMKIAGLGAL